MLFGAARLNSPPSVQSIAAGRIVAHYSALRIRGQCSAVRTKFIDRARKFAVIVWIVGGPHQVLIEAEDRSSSERDVVWFARTEALTAEIFARLHSRFGHHVADLSVEFVQPCKPPWDPSTARFQE